MRATPAPALSGSSARLDSSLAEAARVLRGARHVLVCAHHSPDGDAMGSTLAAGFALEQAGVPHTLFNVDGVPGNLRFLPGADRVRRDLTGVPPVDVTLVLDCSERHRVGRAFPDGGWGGVIVCLDHHATFDAGFPTVFVHDEAACATGELVYRLVSELGVALTGDLATALFCSVQTDTGSFRYGCTTPVALELAGHLVRAGVDVWAVSSALYETVPLAKARLLALALATLHVDDGGLLASIVVSREMIRDAGAEEWMLDGIVNHARGIEGVEVGTLLQESDDGAWRVHFRSRGRVDVSSVAALLGGGGHRNAAGCTVSGTLDEVRMALSGALDWALRSAE